MKYTYGIDFGSNNIVISEKNQDENYIKKIEACLIERTLDGYGIYGNDAKNNLDMPNKKIINPIKNGIIVDKEALTELMRKLFNSLLPRKKIKPEIEAYIITENSLSVKDYNDYREVCYKIGIDSVKFIPLCFCVLYGMNLENSNYSVFSIIDFGADTTKLYISTKNKIIDGYTINIASNDISKDIEDFFANKNLKPYKEGIENLKINYSTLIPSNNNIYQLPCLDKNNLKNAVIGTISSKELYDIIKKRVDDIIPYIKELISSCDYSQQECIRQNKIILCGGMSNLQGLCSYIEDNLGIKVKNSNDKHIATKGLMKILNNKIIKKNLVK